MFFYRFPLLNLGTTLNLNNGAPVYKAKNSVWELLLLLFIFALIIAACYYTTKFLGNKQLKQMKNSNFEVLDTYRVTQNKFLQLVRMGEKFVVIAVCKDTITVLTELSKEEVELPEHSNTQEGSFKNILSDMIKTKKTNGKG